MTNRCAHFFVAWMLVITGWSISAIAQPIADICHQTPKFAAAKRHYVNGIQQAVEGAYADKGPMGSQKQQAALNQLQGFVARTGSAITTYENARMAWMYAGLAPRNILPEERAKLMSAQAARAMLRLASSRAEIDDIAAISLDTPPAGTAWHTDAFTAQDWRDLLNKHRQFFGRLPRQEAIEDSLLNKAAPAEQEAIFLDRIEQSNVDTNLKARSYLRLINLLGNNAGLKSNPKSLVEKSAALILEYLKQNDIQFGSNNCESEGSLFKIYDADAAIIKFGIADKYPELLSMLISMSATSVDTRTEPIGVASSFAVYHRKKLSMKLHSCAALSISQQKKTYAGIKNSI